MCIDIYLWILLISVPKVLVKEIKKIKIYFKKRKEKREYK
jgi:hypothetical protein